MRVYSFRPWSTSLPLSILEFFGCSGGGDEILVEISWADLAETRSSLPLRAMFRRTRQHNNVSNDILFYRKSNTREGPWQK